MLQPLSITELTFPYLEIFKKAKIKCTVGTNKKFTSQSENLDFELIWSSLALDNLFYHFTFRPIRQSKDAQIYV